MSDHPANLHVMTTDSYDELKKEVEAAGGLCIIDFFAPWCGPCKRLIGELPKLAAENPNVTIIKCNCEELPQLSDKFEVGSIPHVCFAKFKDGDIEKLDTIVGFNMAGVRQNITKFA